MAPLREKPVPCECGADEKYDDGSCSDSAGQHWQRLYLAQAMALAPVKARVEKAEATLAALTAETKALLDEVEQQAIAARALCEQGVLPTETVRGICDLLGLTP